MATLKAYFDIPCEDAKVSAFQKQQHTCSNGFLPGGVSGSCWGFSGLLGGRLGCLAGLLGGESAQQVTAIKYVHDVEFLDPSCKADLGLYKEGYDIEQLRFGNRLRCRVVIREGLQLSERNGIKGFKAILCAQAPTHRAQRKGRSRHQLLTLGWVSQGVTLQCQQLVIT
eukprot:4865295-Amphidinium_carterae.1